MHSKLTRHCKSTTLPFEKREREQSLKFCFLSRRVPTESKHNFPRSTVVRDSTLPLQGMGSVSGWRTVNKTLHAALLLLLLSRFSRVRPHRRQPTRLPRPWDSPGRNTGVGCHFLLQHAAQFRQKIKN